MESWVGFISGLVGAVIGGITTWWRLNRELRHGYDRALTSERLLVYRKLWALTEIAPRYRLFKPPSPKELRTAQESLHDWFFNTGGLFLSQPARDAYFCLQNALLRAEWASTDDEKTEDMEQRLLDAGEDLRRQLVQDVGSAQQSVLSRIRPRRPQPAPPRHTPSP